MKNFNITFKASTTVISFLFITNVMYGQIIPFNDSCLAPKTDTATAITGSKVTIGWANNNSTIGYGIRIRALGYTNWSNFVVYAPAVTKTITGLEALTTYQYQVKSFCDASGTNSSAFTPVKYFTTHCNCAVPDSLTSAVISPSSAKIYWIGNNCAVKYRIQYRLSGTTAWTQKIVNAPITANLLNGLLADRPYQYRLRSHADTTGSVFSNWSAIETFTTTMRLEDANTNSVSGSLNIFPNPTEGRFLMTLNVVKNENATLRIIDIIGNEVLHKEIALTEGANNINVTLNDLADGLYLVRLESTEGMITNKLTIKN